MLAGVGGNRPAASWRSTRPTSRLQWGSLRCVAVQLRADLLVDPECMSRKRPKPSTHPHPDPPTARGSPVGAACTNAKPDVEPRPAGGSVTRASTSTSTSGDLDSHGRRGGGRSHWCGHPSGGGQRRRVCKGDGAQYAAPSPRRRAPPPSWHAQARGSSRGDSPFALARAFPCL